MFAFEVGNWGLWSQAIISGAKFYPWEFLIYIQLNKLIKRPLLYRSTLIKKAQWKQAVLIWSNTKQSDVCYWSTTSKIFSENSCGPFPRVIRVPLITSDKYIINVIIGPRSPLEVWGPWITLFRQSSVLPSKSLFVTGCNISKCCP